MAQENSSGVRTRGDCPVIRLIRRLADDGPSRRGSARGKRRANLLGRLKDPHTQKHMPVGKGPACGSSCTDTSRQEARLNQAGDNPEGAKAHVEGVPNTSTPSSGREKRQKSGSRPVGPRARARKKTKRRGSGGAPTPPERHQPPDQDSEHSRRPPRVPQVPYMQRVVGHGGLVGLHTRAQRDRHQKPRGFRVSLGLRRLRPGRRGRGLPN